MRGFVEEDATRRRGGRSRTYLRRGGSNSYDAVDLNGRREADSSGEELRFKILEILNISECGPCCDALSAYL